MFKAKVLIKRRKTILDPQGKATSHALDQLGFESVEDVRIGKHILLRIAAGSIEEARSTAREACEKLLANPVMEDFRIEIVEVELESS